jgi:hypothetical protein
MEYRAGMAAGYCYRCDAPSETDPCEHCGTALYLQTDPYLPTTGERFRLWIQSKSVRRVVLWIGALLLLLLILIVALNPSDLGVS